MKKQLLIAGLLALAGTGAMAQEKTKTGSSTTVKNETTVKKTSSVPQKVHNTFSKHKKYNGKKVKHTREVETKSTDK